MLLAKSCAKKYNIKNGTIRLGSLHEYRQTEIQQIADKEEGLFRFKLNFEGIQKLKTEWFNVICGGMAHIGDAPPISYPGILKAQWQPFHLLSSNNKYVTLKDSTATVKREALNSFIFCMSHVRMMRDCARIFPDYDDYWYMKDVRAPAFGERIRTILKEKIKKDFKNNKFLIPPQTDIENLDVHLTHEKILYTPREIHITGENSIQAEDFIRKMYSMAFIKPPIPFETEREYRFNFIITSRGLIVPPIENSVILNSETLLPLIF